MISAYLCSKNRIMIRSVEKPFHNTKQMTHTFKKIAYLFFTLIAIILIFYSRMSAQFYSIEAKNLRLLYYDKKHSVIIPHLLRCFENSMKFHQKFFDYTPSEKVTVFLQDFDDYGYAGAAANPFNYLVLGIEPYEQVYETTPTNERLNWVMSHELMHIVSLDKSSSTDNFYRSLFFGKVAPTSDHPLSMFYSYLTTPRKYSPRWFLEGIAVFMETWMAGGIGRAQGGYDEMVFRTMVNDSNYFYDVVGLESEGTTIDFQIGANSYLYGTRFMSYLAYQYGLPKLLSWIDRTDSSNRDFASQFEKVFKCSLDEEWSRWIQWEHQWQKENLDSIRRYPLTEYRRISEEPLGSVSRTYHDSTTKKLYAAVNYPGQLAHIVSIDISTGEVRKICDVPSPALYYVCSLAYDQENGLLYYTSHNSGSWRGIDMVDLKTEKTKTLLKDCRTGDLAFNGSDKSLWGVQHNKGLSTIVRFPAPYNMWSEIAEMPYGTDIFDIDISPDGTYLSGSILQISGRQKLVRISINDLLAGNSTFDSLYEFENNAPLNFVHSTDGRYLYGTTYYNTGASNVVRYDFAAKKMECLTNCETGFFRPLPILNDSLVVYRYSGKGFTPVMIGNKPIDSVSTVQYLGYEISTKQPVVRSWTLPSPLTINIDSLTTYTGEYNEFRNMRLVSIYPIIEGYKDVAAFGLRGNVMDALLAQNIDLTGSYTPNQGIHPDERWHLSLNYAYWRWKFSASYNRADFYDLFGPTKVSRKGHSLTCRFSDNLIYDAPAVLDYSSSISWFGGLQRMPEYQNVDASYDQFLAGDARLNYRNLARSLGAVEAEQGSRGQLTLLDYHVNGRSYPRWYGTTDYGLLLPIDHSSIWFRGALGYAFGDRSESFSNFFFGGFENNWLDYQSSKRYREYSSFPGVEINKIGGTNFAKLLVEWVLPPLRFRRFGFMNLYCNWAHLNFFSSSIVTNVEDKDYKQLFFNAGAQVDFKIVLLSRLESTLSLGYAIAAEKRQRPTKEFMISLKIL